MSHAPEGATAARAAAPTSAASIAEQVVRVATAARATIAVAESLTGGALAAAVVAVPGASKVLRLGVVAYDTAMKASVLGVDAQLLAERGAVDGDVACRMAEGVRALADVDGPADVGVATTGVAGPDAQDGHAPGEVHVGIATAAGSHAIRLDLAGDRDAIRAASVEAALTALLRAVGAMEAIDTDEVLSPSTGGTGHEQE